MLNRFNLLMYYASFFHVPNLIRELILYLCGKHFILMNCVVNYKFAFFHKSNWGDDLNYYLPKILFDSKILVYHSSWLSRYTHKTNYMCIGSTINEVNSETIVWGSGVISEDKKYSIKKKPKQVLAVRGKLTRDYLLKNGIECPEVYGDPALLLPLIYKKDTKVKKYILGVIPHICDESNQYVEELKNNSRIQIISIKDYDDWHSVIDKICECEFIMSSSLHGIIVSDAYHIPNLWVEFSDQVIGNGFKFRDYYSSVGKNLNSPMKINKSIDVDNVIQYKDYWIAPHIDLKPLIKACPFKLDFFNPHDLLT